MNPKQAARNSRNAAPTVKKDPVYKAPVSGTSKRQYHKAVREGKIKDAQAAQAKSKGSKVVKNPTAAQKDQARRNSAKKLKSSKPKF